MQFHEEIEKLQARVKALEEQFGNDAPATDDVPAGAYTIEYLVTLDVDAIGVLYKAGKIDVAQLGAAVTRKVFPQGVPAELELRGSRAEPIPAEVVATDAITDAGVAAPADAAVEDEPVAEADPTADVDEPETEVEEPASAEISALEVEDEGLES